MQFIIYIFCVTGIAQLFRRLLNFNLLFGIMRSFVIHGINAFSAMRLSVVPLAPIIIFRHIDFKCKCKIHNMFQYFHQKFLLTLHHHHQRHDTIIITFSSTHQMHLRGKYDVVTSSLVCIVCGSKKLMMKM